MAHQAALDRSDGTTLPPWAVLVALIGISQLAGLSGAAVTDASFYRELVQPSWAPPGWLFGPVWLTLYTVMGVAAWLVWRTRPGADRSVALRLFAVQLALNAIWTPIFFGLRSLGGGLVVIALLDVAIFATIVWFGRCSRRAAWLMVPYAAWVGFATALNTSLWLLN